MVADSFLSGIRRSSIRRMAPPSTFLRTASCGLSCRRTRCETRATRGASCVLRPIGHGVEARRLRVDAANADLLTETNALRAALLQAVSHDFRTLPGDDQSIGIGPPAHDASSRNQIVDFCCRHDDAADRSTDVRDLLDMSRLQVGALDFTLRSVAWETVAAALSGLAVPQGRVEVDVPSSLPTVLADGALLNAPSPPCCRMLWRGHLPAAQSSAGRSDRQCHRSAIVDRGQAFRWKNANAFPPFQRPRRSIERRRVGLGLAIAKGFRGRWSTMSLDDTPAVADV